MAKLPVKDILAAIDMGAREVWDEFSDEEKKSVSFWLLNRYVSNVKGSREKQELAVLQTNEYFNKHYMVVSKHPKLQWQLLCLSGNSKKIQFHPWQGFKKYAGEQYAKRIKVLEQILPNTRSDELEILAKMYTDKELIELAEDYGIKAKL